MSTIPRPEYPRPDFVRNSWLPLNGAWRFSFDEPVFDREITVPFVYQCAMSGIGLKEFHENIWYERSFVLPAEMKHKRLLLHFGAVDYICRVWVNGVFIGEHTGGHTSFTFDITHAVHEGAENILRVQACDPPFDLDIPRGKQYWEEESSSIFYTASSGIWQSVWLEAVNKTYIRNVHITPLLDERAVRFEYALSGCKDAEFSVEISFEGRYVTAFSTRPQALSGAITVQLEQPALKVWNFVEDMTWSPETPRLFDVKMTLEHNGVTDEVASYFGMRKVSVQNGVFMLNNRPYYQRLVLDQGYWEPSLLTAPADEDYIRDIELTKQMGFNGVRKHQKVEDPRYLYHADRLGLLVWGEMAAAYTYIRRYAQAITAEWMEAVKRDYSHPCIVVWVPLNESWGVQEVCFDPMVAAHCNAMYYLTKSLDATRLVVDNDGWEHTGGDLLTIHDYEYREAVLAERYQTRDSIVNAMPAGRSLYAAGGGDAGQPILVTEFGGISYKVGAAQNGNEWGYSAAKDEEDFLGRYAAVVRPVLKSRHIQGFCYTQLTDVEQEINGLLTYGRKPKADMDAIRSITLGGDEA